MTPAKLKDLFNNESQQWFTLSRAEIKAIIEALDKKDKVIRLQSTVLRELRK